MKMARTMKPYFTELKPLSMFSWPSDGPTVRSSTISSGAASAPARISSATSLASRVVMRPLICTRPPPISSRMTGAVMTSALPFSTSTIAIRLPTLSRVSSLKIRAPLPSRFMCTAGSLLRWSKPGCASLMRSPVRTTCRLTSTFWPPRSTKRSLPNGTLPASAASIAPGSSLTIRISSDAVRPRMSLARAVSCTPGSCTTTRSAPCCWMIGSATPSSLTRLRRIWMFCWTAPSWMRFCASGFSPAMRQQVAAGAVALAQRQVGVVLLDDGARLRPLRTVLEAHHDVGAVARDAAVLDLLVAHQRADVGRVAVAGLVERGLHVDLQQEMHAAAQVEAQVHRQRADRRQPLRRRRQQVERDDVVVAQLRLDDVPRLQLRVGVGEAHLDAGGVERRAAEGNVAGLERVLDHAEQRRVGLHLGRADLHRRHFGKEVGQRVQDADDQRDGDHDVLPERITIHGGRPVSGWNA